MKKLLLLSAGLVFCAGFAMADVTAEQLITAYQAQGYTAIEVTTGPSQIKVEANFGQTRVEAIYDISTGAQLERHEAVAGQASTASAAQVATAGEDFLSGSDGTAMNLADGADDGTEADGEDSSSDGTGTDVSGSESGSDSSDASGGDDSSDGTDGGDN